ncbi:MAG TPA: glycosyltransferase, partial [Roseobacter sp.]|nr:glycosyltransferase [Roseobacter sp.]
PLRLATRLSFVSLLMAGLIGVYVIYSLIIYQTAPGWASVVLAISFFSGVQLLTLGILGEYIGRLYVEAKNRPLYFVSEEARDIAPVAQRLRA